jgi:hypothetical protein
MMKLSTTQKKIGYAMLRAIGVLVIVAVTMEVLARLDDHFSYGAPLTSNYNFDRMFDFDGVVMKGIPHARYAKWELNSIGMRGPELQTSHGQSRILVYGASEAFGIYEKPGHEFPRELESALNSSQPGRYEVINAGIPGMRIGSGSAYLEGLGKSMSPAMVLLYPTPTHYIGVSHPMCGRPKKTITSDTKLPESRLAQKASDRVKEVLPATALTAMRRASIWWEARRYSPLDLVPEASMAAFDADLRCAIQAVRSIGAVPVLSTHASRFGTVKHDDDDYWLVGWRRQYPELKEDGFLDLEQRANKLIRAVAKEEGVILVDADQELSGHAENFADHAHFTDKGSERMGRFVAEQVRLSIAASRRKER